MRGFYLKSYYLQFKWPLIIASAIFKSNGVVSLMFSRLPSTIPKK